MERFAAIPDELKRLPQWVCWALVDDPKRPDKPKKIPIDPRTGGGARSNDAASWRTFDECLREVHKYSGLGFMFANGYFGVDIDGVGMEDEIVKEFLTTLHSYAERSQSGHGIHIICRGSLPPRGNRHKNVEMYQAGRFFVMTGDRIGDYAEIADGTEAIKGLHARYIGSATEIVIKPQGQSGDKFQALWEGRWQGMYSSQSEADLALCSILVYRTKGNIAEVDRLFRQSGLMRQKWDERNYGTNTLAKARSGYTPQNEIADVTFETLDDMGNARRFIRAAKNAIRYSYIDRAWLVYDGKRWQLDQAGAIDAIADTVPEQIQAQMRAAIAGNPEDVQQRKVYEQFLRHSRSNAAKKAMIDEAQHLVAIVPAQLDAHPEYINTPNCVINCRTGAVMSHAPEQFLTRITNVAYNPKAECPRWLAFLDEIFAGDKDLIRFFQKSVGYSLTGSIQEQCSFFLHGDGANGKSTALEVVYYVCGDYAMNVQPTTLIDKKGQGGGANSDIARLKGARFVTSVEPNEGMRLDEGLLKQLTGGDVVTARRLYGHEFEFHPEFKIWMATNHKPVIRGTDTGIWRRIRLIPFTVQIPPEKRDPHLAARLRSEAEGILRWAIEGCALWRKEGLEPPASVAEATAEYRGEMDIIAQFLEARTVKSPYSKIKATDLYRAYVDWATEGNEFRMTATRFGREIKKKLKAVKGREAIEFVGLSFR